MIYLILKHHNAIKIHDVWDPILLFPSSSLDKVSFLFRQVSFGANEPHSIPWTVIQLEIPICILPKAAIAQSIQEKIANCVGSITVDLTQTLSEPHVATAT